MDSVAHGTLINLATRVLAVGLGLAITLYTARLGPMQQGTFALFTAVEAVLLALGSGFGVAIARRISHHGERPAGLVAASVLACVAGGLLVGAALLAMSTAAGGAYQALAGRPQDNEAGYTAGSPITHAGGLRGRLLIVHGSGDDNVHYQGTERLVNHLVELGKTFDLMVYPNRSHCICEGPGTTLHVYSLGTRSRGPSAGRGPVTGPG